MKTAIATRKRITHVDTTAISVTRLVLIEGTDEGDRPELVYVAGSREEAEAFAAGFNLAQMFTEGRAIIGSEAVGLTLVKQEVASNTPPQSLAATRRWLDSVDAR